MRLCVRGVKGLVHGLRELMFGSRGALCLSREGEVAIYMGFWGRFHGTPVGLLRQISALTGGGRHLDAFVGPVFWRPGVLGCWLIAPGVG